jgi:branched-chain amino acid transport system permease protein
MRFITERKAGLESGQMIVTFGLVLMFGNLSSFLLGDLPRVFPSFFAGKTIEFKGAVFSLDSIAIILVTSLVMTLVMLFFSKTNMGLKMEAVAENIMAARLRGIHASNVLAFSWGIIGLMGIIGGMLIAPKIFVSPQMLTHVLVYSMIGVVIGGLESPFGAILCGVGIGVIENIAANVGFIGTELKFGVVFLVLVVCLIIKPYGFFGKKDFRRV